MSKYRSQYMKQWLHTESGKASKAASSRKTREATRRIIVAAKDCPCSDCGVRYPYYVMDFDHREGKKFQIGSRGTRTIGMMLAEIAKCDVVCANCHREREHQRRENERRDPE